MPTPQNIPDPNTIHPIAGYDKEIMKNLIR